MDSRRWAKLKHHIEALRPPGIEPFEQLANDLAAAYTSGDEKIVRAINANFGTSFPTDFHDPEKCGKACRHGTHPRHARPN